MKKHLLLWLSLAALAFPSLVSAQDSYDWKEGAFGFSDTYNDNYTVNLTYSEQKTGDLVLPSQVEHRGKTYTVTGIAGQAFKSSSVHSVIIPEGVTTIGESVFSGCKKLQYVQLPSTLTAIGANAFYQCTAMPSVVIPTAITFNQYTYSGGIGDGAFYGCSSLANVYVKTSDVYCAYYDGTESSSFDFTASQHFYFLPDNLSSFTTNWPVPSVLSDQWTLTLPAGYMAYTPDVDLDLTAARTQGLRALAVSGYETLADGAVKLTLQDAGDVIPAGTGLLLKGESGKAYTLKMASSALPVESNLLTGALYDRTLAATDSLQPYMLSGKEFRKVADTTLAKGSAALLLPSSVTASEIGIDSVYTPSNPVDSDTIVTDPNAVYVTAGQLGAKLGDRAYSISKLKIKGNINGTDIKLLRAMAGYVKEDDGGGDIYTAPRREEAATGILDTLDLSEAHIVAGGVAFYTEGTMEARSKNGVVPAYCFKGCWKLKHIDLPTDVTAIENNAFDKCYYLYSINVPDGVTSIGKNAFDGDWRLRTASLPEGLQTIEEKAFYESGLRKVVVPDNVTTLGTRAFAHCYYLKEATVGSGVKEIGTSAFALDTVLTTITLKEGLETVGDNAFGKCKMLTRADLPSTVQTIEFMAFASCDSLVAVTLPAGLQRIGASAFAHSENLREMIIPDNVTSFGANVFTGCKRLAKVVVGTGITKIPSETFYGSGVKDVTLPEGITEIGEKAFYDCDVLEELTLPQTVTTVGRMAFADDSLLAMINIPDGVDTLDAPFYRTFNLEDVYLSNGLREIPAHLLAYNTKLHTINVPEQITKIGEGAFYQCEQLPEFPFPATLTTIDDYAFSYCRNLDGIVLKGTNITRVGTGAFAYNDKIEEIVIPEEVSIGEQLFVGCSALKTAIIEGDRHFLPYGDFAYCTSLDSVVLAANTDWIASYAFSHCTALKKFTLPASINLIGKGCFDACTSLTTLTCEAVVPPVIDDAENPFTNMDQQACTLFVPEGSEESYRLANIWKNFYQIVSTDINGLRTESTDNAAYFDLNGRQVSPSARGIVISKGKKWLRK